MRIRLQVLRNRLPPTKVIWKVDSDSTTAELVTKINGYFPLEAEGWGLEDYAVHLGGYELLHFQKLGDVLKEDDELVIQPLQTKDIRARRLSGRAQISREGRHLVDGVAFGRLRSHAQKHPPVKIPPRKPGRTDLTLEESDALLQLGNFGPPPSIPEALGDSEVPSDYEASDDPEPREAPFGYTRSKTQKHVKFSEEFMAADYNDNGAKIMGDYDFDTNDKDKDDDDDDDDDDDFEPSSGDDSDAEEDTAMKLLENIDETSARSTPDESSSESDSESESDSSDHSGSDSDAPSEEPIKKKQDNPVQQPPAPVTRPKSAAASATTQAPPSDGKQRTRARNRRRRDAKKLAWLKSKGHLPATANRQDLKKWREANETGRVSASDSDSGDEDSSSSDSDSSSDSSSDSDSDVEAETEQIEEVVPLPVKKPVPMVPRQLKVKPKGKKPLTDTKSEEFNQKREALLASLQSGGVDINHDLSTVSSPSEDVIMDTAEPSTATAQPEVRRARLDLASSNRLLFNSLGVRAPKNDADRQRLQAKLAAPVRKPVAKPTTATAPIQESPIEEEEVDSTDVNAWQSKISLSAVECAPGQEEYYYSTPPFPFYKRWDPSQRTKKRKRGSQPFDSSKLQRTEEELDNSYSEYYNEGADGDALNYGDGEDETAGAPESDQEAATAQLLAESSDAADLPALPSDLSTLPPLTNETTLPGAIIAFARFEVSAATNWAPAMSPVRTASIQHVSDNKSLGLQLAKRDIPGKQYDSQGRRLFEKFEMITGDEDEDGEDDGFLEIDVAEMIDPRLVQAAETREEGVIMEESPSVENNDHDTEMIEMNDLIDDDYVLVSHPNDTIATESGQPSSYLSAISTHINTLSPKLRTISLAIHDNPELNYKEFKAYDLLVEFFKGLHGWTVEPHAYGIKTAFIASFEHGGTKAEERSKKQKKVVCFNVEYDALPGIGHACGHNLIAIASIAAALATRHVMENFGIAGKVVVFGTPAEEGGGGKIKLLNAGAYTDHKIDISLISHPGITPDASLVRTSAFQAFRVEYFGKEAHAAAAPWEGINALDAMMTAYTALSVLRQQTQPGDIIQGCITQGGVKPNIIHAYAAGDFVVRSSSKKRLEALKKRVDKCFEGAAVATGAKLKMISQSRYLDHVPNLALGRGYAKYFKELGGEMQKPEIELLTSSTQASTDQGDISHAMPSLSPGFWIESLGLDGEQGGGPHTPDFTRASRTKEAHEKALMVGKALAATAIDVLTVDGYLEEIKKEFEASRGS
ncbi:hypothetical protein E4T39_08757 [Aureobasidium subglaciale]|nr:hypothetical protein E4T39_08757 [Aureobasidium subglaciale]